LPDPERRYGYYPHELSGGQKQRVVIACDPKIIIADEPTTALDVTVQAEILELLRDLRDRLGSAILLITHNMGVVADLADRVVVMNAGKVVETATVAKLFAAPSEDYTRTLLAAVTTSGRATPSTSRPMNRPKLSSKSTTSACILRCCPYVGALAGPGAGPPSTVLMPPSGTPLRLRRMIAVPRCTDRR
jgi:peptide/nickel transport system ATP-binding protein